MKLTKLLENTINRKLNLAEAKKVTKKGYELFLAKIDELGKSTQYKKFLNDLPNGGSNSPLVTDLTNMFDSLESTDIENYAKAFKSKTINGIKGMGISNYDDLFNINIEKATGKGELMIAFLVKNAIHMGSSTSYDVFVGGKDKYEVKDISTGNIRPGREGKISNYAISSQLVEIFRIVSLIKDDIEIQKSILTLGDATKLQTIIDIINTVSTKDAKTKSIDIYTKPGDIGIGNLNSLFNALRRLSKELDQSPIKKDVTTSKLKVKSSNFDSTFWIPEDDVDDIIKAAGKNKEAKIKVGNQITDETKDAASILVDLMRNPLVKDPMIIVKQFRAIKNKFFGEKKGLIYFKGGKLEIVDNMDTFATVAISGDNYRFDIADRYTKYDYIQLQLK
jgi:hypothetical protein